MALLNYRSPDELNERFERSWQGVLDPLGQGGRFAVEIGDGRRGVHVRAVLLARGREVEVHAPPEGERDPQRFREF